MAQAETKRPFDDIRNLIAAFPSPDAEGIEKVRGRREERRPGGPELGQLDGIVEWLAAWQGRCSPTIERPGIALFASAYGGAIDLGEDPDVAKGHIDAIRAGSAPVNVAASGQGAGLRVFDLALEQPTRSIAEGPTFTEPECAGTIAFGMEAVAAEMDLMILGDAGCGSNLAATALASTLFDLDPAECSFAPSQEDMGNSANLINQARQRLGSVQDPLDILAEVGARETAAQVGAIMAARIQKIPVLLDGASAALAAALVRALSPDGLDHCRLASAGAGPGATLLAEKLELIPLVGAHIEQSQGLAGTLALTLIRSACEIHASGPGAN